MTPIPRLSNDARRAQIVEAVTPAVLEHGAAITSRQLADAAGVAEGTLFKAFGDKESLLTALVEHHMTDERTEGFESDSLEAVVETMVGVLVERMRFMFQLVVALGPIAQRVAGERRADFEQSKHWIAEHFEPYAGQLRVTPLVAADLVRTLSWAAAASWGEDAPVSSADDILQVLLHGIVRTDAEPDASAPTPLAGPPASVLEDQKA
ncbi:TetR/AcrR family transcriptional regulator [Agrococcus sp. Marseille-P2731]|uniref:TetR/AcrR family transcriptional regulator n=1 Tax=Agrococcus sp. Marseille-P2731 TaxID=1841862 RepID=UPI00093202AC|nr:TetR/AcrR family transcriptional regulator [Agrococcus sp. Marseille-P2731]